MFIPREGLPCERQLLSWCQHLSIISSRFISEKTKPPVCCAFTQQDSACPTNTKGSGCLTVTAGIKADGLAHAHQATGASSSCQCPGPPCRVPLWSHGWCPVGLPAWCLLWSHGWCPWSSLPGVHSGVVGGAQWASLPGVHFGVMGGTPGPPCLGPTLESWVVPVGHLAWCPLWSHGHLARWRLGGHLITIYKYPKGRLRKEEVIKFHMF